MANRFLGFLVLRCPEHNFDKEGRGAFLKTPPEINGLYYAGIDRMQWFDVDEGIDNECLPEELLGIREKIEDEVNPSEDLRCCRCIEDARKLLDFSNEQVARNELVAVFEGSETPEKCLAEGVINESFLGYDFYCDGYGSMIREGVFTKPALFSMYLNKLNPFGLFTSDSNGYIDHYSKVSNRGEIEPMRQKVRKLLVFRVQ